MFYADGKKVAEIFGVYPNELQDFYLGNFSRLAQVVPWQRQCAGDKSWYWTNYHTYTLTNCEILLNCEFSYENQYAHSARSPYQLQPLVDQGLCCEKRFWNDGTATKGTERGSY